MVPEVERIDRQMVYRNRWMTVWEDRVRLQNDSEGIFGVVDKPDFSLVVPWDGSGFYLVEQYRYAVEGRYWEFPQGSLENSPDAGSLDIARAELAEETGMVANSFTILGKLFGAYGFCNQGVTVFLATELTQGESNLEVTEAGLVCRRFNLEEIWGLIDNGSMRDAPSIAAMALLTRNVLQN